MVYVWEVERCFQLDMDKKYEKMKMSLILTIVSLGTRVLLAYLLAPSFGLEMIWWAIVIGWILADTIGILYGIKIEKWFK